MSWFKAPPVLLPDLIARHGRWLADTPALIDGEVVLNWREFAAGTARVAHGLESLGVRPRGKARCFGPFLPFILYPLTFSFALPQTVTNTETVVPLPESTV